MGEPNVLSGVAAAPVIVALVAVAGMASPRLPRRVYPALALLFGVAWQCAVDAVAGEASLASVLVGVVLGLAASGLYSGAVKPVTAAWRRP